MRNLYLPLLACLMLLSQNACIPDIEEVKFEDWQPELAIPVLNTKFAVQDLLDNFETGGFLEKDPNNFLTVVYQGNVFSQRGDEIITVPSFSIPMLDTAQLIPYGNLPFDFEITRIVLKEGSFNYYMESEHTEDLDVEIQIPNLVKNGNMLKMGMVLDYTGNGTVIMDNSMDLNGYVFDFSSDLELKYIANKQGNNQREQLTNVSFSFSNLKYSYIEGKLGQYVFNLPLESIVMDVFNQASGGSVYFEDPSIVLTFKNSYGMPIRMAQRTFDAHSLNDGIKNLVSPLNAGIDFNYPGLAEAGEFKTTRVVLDKNSSNIAEIIASNPTQIDYQFTAISDPFDSKVTGFAQDDSFFEVDVDVELPLWLKAENFSYESTGEFDLADVENIEEIEFKLLTENGLPLDSKIQLYFENDTGTVLDSLLGNGQQLLLAAEVDNEGIVTAPGTHSEIISITGNRIDVIQSAKIIRFKASLSTANNGNTAVRLFSDYEIDLKLGAKAVFKPEN